MIDIFFTDDSQQSNPTRPGMGPLVAAGFIHVPAEHVNDLENRLDSICSEKGFPKGPSGEFKWSPGRELWMHANLREESRSEFFLAILGEAQSFNVGVTVVIEDTSRRPAIAESSNHKDDITRLIIERVEKRLERCRRTGIVIVDRPSGGRAEENKFLRECLETISSGTSYVKPARIAINVLSTPSALLRCLQLADVVTGATLSYVSGEDVYSPQIFEAIKPLLCRDGSDRISGIGLKIHPHLRFLNLYHWILQESYFWHGLSAYDLPMPRFPYSDDPLVP